MVVSPYMGVFSRKQSVAGRLARFAIAGVSMGGAIAIGQATTTLVMPEGPLLPAKFGAWTATAAPGAGGSDTGAPGASRIVEGKGAEVLKEDGLTRSSEQTYTQAGRGGTVKLNALQFTDATGAVSAYTYLRSPEMKEMREGSRVGRNEAVAGGRYLFREGASTVLVEVSAPGPTTADDLRTLANMLPKIGGPKGAPPLLPTLLPAERLIPESVHYAVGPLGYAAMGGTLPAGLLGFEKSSEVTTAEYAVHGGGKGLLTLLLFPTPQIAGDRGRAIEAALNTAGERGGTAKLKREGSLVLLANGGFTPAEAAELVDKIHLRSEVTWNKQMPPEFHTEVRKTASLLVSIAVFSGVAGLAAVLLGLFLGFGRAWVRVLMGKPAATEPEFLRLDLGGAPGKVGTETKPAGL